MNKSAKFRFLITLLMLTSLLLPSTALAFGKGKKHFKKGLKHEVAEEWDKAVEEFALAIADNPKNPEYRLHYRRSIFNASQMFMKTGRKLASEQDYEGAYTAFRKAYGYDPVNELAKSEMARMLRLQKALIDGETIDENTGEVKLIKTSSDSAKVPDDIVVPQRYEVLRNVTHPNPFPLQTLIRTLAQSLDLNVLFDSSSSLSRRKIQIELKNVTSAQALDAIFLQENLFFEKVGPRTIIVAASTRRQFFQQLVLRTFYLGNANPKKVAALIQKAIPAQPGRTPTIVLTDEDTNSLTIRDTAENIRLMSGLIKSLDKDRAEVVMDVQIYEVSKNDLLKLGNQIGAGDGLKNELNNLGGSTAGSIPFGGTLGAATSIATGILVPSSVISAFQSKSKTKLIASTQIHAFNNEESSARIGQRVPVQTASVSSFNSNQDNTTPTGGFGTGFPVINYEQVGLTLKFKPIVFPNQDVQVAMDIESKDIIDASTLTPTFTERTIKGTARIQNNKTLMLASVAQGTQSKGRQGLPLLGLIPVIGRLFSTPTNDNRQVDIVIAVTPRVIRAPAILPEDLEPRQTGSLAVPTSGSLSALLFREEVKRQQNLARLEKRNTRVQLPDAPAYVKSSGADAVSSNKSKDSVKKSEAETTESSTSPKTTDKTAINLRKIDSQNVRTLDLSKALNRKTNANSGGVKKTSLTSGESEKTATRENTPTAIFQIMPTNLAAMKAGEKTKVAVMIRSATPFRSAVLGLTFDDKKVAVRSVEFGDVFGLGIAQTPQKPFINQGGKMYVSLQSPQDISQNSSGILAYIEIEALEEGVPNIAFETDMLNVLTADGNNFVIRF